LNGPHVNRADVPTLRFEFVTHHVKPAAWFAMLFQPSSTPAKISLPHALGVAAALLEFNHLLHTKCMPKY
jgi:hypothetical protein